MKILLLGEFSALHQNLKEGLEELGHEVIIASSGDDWKKIARDININYDIPYLPKQISERITPFFHLKKFSSYDVVQLINPFIFYKSNFPNKFYIDQIIKNNKKFFLLAAGSDSFYWRHGRKALNYGPFEDHLKYDLKINKHIFEDEKHYEFNKYVVEKSKGVIPIMYEYEASYRGHENLKETIPIPLNINKIQYEENKINNKLVIFHGLNRYGFKGTMYVEKAFEILADKYPNDLELIIDGQMPLSQYLELMKRTNVVIDQTSSYSSGVNGIYALAMGKIVLGGAEPESLKSLGVQKSPIINIKSDVDSIVSAVEKLLQNKKDITKLGYESRKFAEDIHSHIKVAEQYIKLWNQ